MTTGVVLAALEQYLSSFQEENMLSLLQKNNLATASIGMFWAFRKERAIFLLL